MSTLQKKSVQIIANNIKGKNFKTKLENLEKLNISYQLKNKIIKKLKKNEIKDFINADDDQEIGFIMENYVTSNKIDAVDIFLEYYPNYVDIYNTEYFGQTPLYLATEFDLYDMSKLLLEYDADPNSPDFEDGITPLINTCYNKNTKIAKLLLDYDADPNLQNHRGTSPLFIAILDNNIDMVRLLLEYDADPNLKSRLKDNETTLEAAKNNKQIIKLLKQYGAK